MAKKSLREWLIGKPELPSAESYRRPKIEVPGEPKPVSVPVGRSSIPHQPSGPSALITGLGSEFRIITHPFIVQVIPLIRRLMMINPDIGQAIQNIVSLGNTGHKVIFDKTIPLDQVQKMRQHLEEKKEGWSAGCAGMDGLVNKMFAQALVGGAVSNEWVVNKKMDGVETVILVNPEDITFTLDEGNVKYRPWQRIIAPGGFMGASFNPSNAAGLIPLNPYTYKYYALNGDTEVPYGFPPYLAALENIATQRKMNKNIDFTTDLWGLIGFLEVLVQKPDKIEGENDEQYAGRLDKVLQAAQKALLGGMNEGAVVGFQDDHTFKFNSFASAAKEALELYRNNELMIGSGIKQDMTLLGRDYNTSETQITVVFIKMLSELKNIQNLIRVNLEFGYKLELTLAGFDFKYLKVQFNPSTLQDHLKYQQAEEIKVRNVLWKYVLGVISQDTMADELGYESPAEDAPLVDPEVLAGVAPQAPADAEGAQKKEKGKDKSDKKTRDKNKPVSKDK